MLLQKGRGFKNSNHLHYIEFYWKNKFNFATFLKIVILSGVCNLQTRTPSIIIKYLLFSFFLKNKERNENVLFSTHKHYPPRSKNLLLGNMFCQASENIAQLTIQVVVNGKNLGLLFSLWFQVRTRWLFIW